MWNEMWNRHEAGKNEYKNWFFRENKRKFHKDKQKLFQAQFTNFHKPIKKMLQNNLTQKKISNNMYTHRHTHPHTESLTDWVHCCMTLHKLVILVIFFALVDWLTINQSHSQKQRQMQTHNWSHPPFATQCILRTQPSTHTHTLIKANSVTDPGGAL